MLEESCKIIFIGDPHNSDVAPATRTDDYTQAILSKIDFVFSYALTKTIPNIVFLGDMFHRKRPSLNSHELVQKLMSLFFSFKIKFQEIHKKEARIFAVVGNHDFQFTIENLDQQPISVLAESGALELLNNIPVHLEAGVELNGIPYADELESNPEAYNLAIGSEAAFKVWCFHSTLLPDGCSFFKHWVNFSNLKDLKADVVAVGHYHPGFKTEVKYNKTWINPGALSRGTSEDHNLTREIRVVALLRKSDGTVITKDIPIPVEQSDKVFAVQTIKAAKQRNSEITQFVDAMGKSVAKTTDVTSVEGLKRAATDLTDDVAVLKLVFGYIEASAEEQGL